MIVARAFLIGFVAFVFGSVGGAAASSAPHAVGFDDIDAFAEAQVRAWHIPGAALVIVQDGGPAHLQTFGRAGRGRPVTPQTPFEIGSCSKSFTALAVMQLAEAGRLDLDAPVHHYVPWFRTADPAASARITTRRLLNHTSGISSEANALVMVNRRGLSLSDWVRGLHVQRLTAPPGARYQYSNLGYMALAVVIQEVSGQSYDTYLKEHLFRPLGMRNSFSDPGLARANGLSDGHTWWWGQPLPSLEEPRPDMLGAGYLMVSPEDMARYLIAQLNGGVIGDAQVLSADGVAAMHTPAVLPVEKTIYGMGWVRYMKGEHTIVNHNGQSAGFTASMILLPQQNIGISVMANASSSLAPHAAWSMASAVKNALLHGHHPQVDPAFRTFFLPWGGGFLLASALVFWRVARLRRRFKDRGVPRAMWRSGLSLGLDVLLALAAGLGLPLAVGWTNWRGLFVWQPDAAYWCLAAALLLTGKLLLRAIFAVARAR